jgi:hypothetical protein
MKKIFVLGLIASAFLFGCSDDPTTTPATTPVTTGGDSATTGGGSGEGTTTLIVENTQRAFMAYVGASWCPPCGSAGGPGFKEIRKTFSNDELVGLYFAPSGVTAPYVGDGNPAPYLSTMSSNVTKSTGTIPYYSINGVNVGGAYTQPSATLSVYRGFIDDKIAESAKLGIAAKQTLTDGALSCEVAIEAFDEYDGDIYYSVLAVEKSAIGFQKVGGVDEYEYDHTYITRASLIGDGTMDGQELFKSISSGSVSTGTKFSEKFSLEFENIQAGDYIFWEYTPENTVIVASIWSKEANGEYTYVNSVIAE